MEFRATRPDVIRAVNQRWLMNYWKHAKAGRTLPLWQELEGRGFDGMVANLSIADVVPSDGDVRFLIRYHGARITEACGCDCDGRYLDEVLPPTFRDVALATYRQVTKTRQAVYTSVDITDIDGHLVHFERLLLPFSSGGDTVTRILASLEMISPDGAFQTRDLMASARTPSSYAVYATIADGI